MTSSILRTLLTFYFLINFNTAFAANVCRNKPLFDIRYNITFEEAHAQFIQAGGRDADIVKVVDKSTILKNFGAYKLPEQFSYSKKSRDQWGYKFSISDSCIMHASFYEYKYKTPHSFRSVHHHLAAQGDQVYTAGVVFFFHNGENIEKVVLSNRSSRFCPSLDSLVIAKDYLVQMGIDPSIIEMTEDDNCRS